MSVLSPITQAARLLMVAFAFATAGGCGDTQAPITLSCVGGEDCTFTNSTLTVFIPAAAIPAAGLDLTATPTTNTPGAVTLVDGSSWDIGPTGTTFSPPAQVTIGYTDGSLQALTGVQETDLGVYKVIGSQWQPVAGSVVDANANTITVSISSLSVYGILGTPVDRVTVSPTSGTLQPTQTLQLTATALDAGDVELPGRPITWSSDNESAATVSQTGLVTAVADGSAEISAVSNEGTGGTANITVQTQQTGGPYPNEPPGFTQLLEYDGSTQDPPGWIFNDRWTLPNYTTLLNPDPNPGPQSPATTLRRTWPIGAEGSTGIATHGFGGGLDETYCSLQLRWSDPWDYHNSLVNKIFFISTNETSLNNEMVISLIGASEQGAAIMMNVQSPSLNGGGPVAYFPPNGPGGGQISLGDWHQIEIHLIGNSGGQANGVARWWVDNVLVGDHSNVQWQTNATVPGRFNQLNINSVWGGQGDAKQTQDFLDMDHVYCSGR